MYYNIRNFHSLSFYFRKKNIRLLLCVLCSFCIYTFFAQMKGDGNCGDVDVVSQWKSLIRNYNYYGSFVMAAIRSYMEDNIVVFFGITFSVCENWNEQAFESGSLFSFPLVIPILLINAGLQWFEIGETGK